MNSFLKKHRFIILVVLASTLYSIYIHLDYKNANKRYSVSDYTTVTHTGKIWLIKSTFMYKGKRYTISNIVENNCANRVMNSKNRFIIEFKKNEPNVGTIICNYEVFDSNFVAPYEGWSTNPLLVPSWLPKNE